MAGNSRRRKQSAKLPREETPKKAIQRFKKHGWKVHQGRGKGSHIHMKHPDKDGFITLPSHRKISTKTLHKCIKAAGLTIEQYLGNE